MPRRDGGQAALRLTLEGSVSVRRARDCTPYLGGEFELGRACQSLGRRHKSHNIPARAHFAVFRANTGVYSRAGTSRLTQRQYPDIFPIRNMKIHDTTMLGRTIREERKRLGATQKELAMTAGTGLRFIIELEKGKSTSQTGKVFQVIQALGLSVDIAATESSTQQRNISKS
jgi:HTH-type transcriptional regulator/antitoxin HipB